MIVLFVIATVIAYCAFESREGGNALKPLGKQSPELELAHGGSALYSIVVPANANHAEAKAAQVLADALKAISGAEFEIVSEAKTSGKYISVGNSSASAGLRSEAGDLGLEGYAVAVHDSNIYVFGGGLRGVLNGVYSLLEEDFGCRWYAQQSFDCPNSPNLSIAVAERVFVPRLDIRDPYYFEAWDTDWSLQNKSNSPNAYIPAEFGGNSKYALFCHTYARFFDPDTEFDKHPEYFAEINGRRTPSQLCVTNAEVIEGSIRACRKYLLENPEATIISISPNDGRGYCECEKCKAIDDAEQGKAGSMLAFTNTIADALKEEFPQITFMILAYLDTFYPPKTIRPRENVAVQLCTDSHAWKYQFCFITESQDFQNALRAWAQIGASVYIWDYTTDFVHYLVPMANMPVVRDNIQFYIDNNARGVMLQGAYMSSGSDMVDMRCWVWAKQLWNPQLDTKSLMKDFIFGYYREAAEAIWQYNMMIWDYWEHYHSIPHVCGEPSDNPILDNLHCSYAPDGPMFTEEFMERASKYMEDAAGLASSELVKSRVRKVKASLLYLKISQGIGYYTEFGSFRFGKDVITVPTRQIKNKESYLALYKEFLDICSEHQITALSEQNDMDKIVGKWHAVLTVDPIPGTKLSGEWNFVKDPENVGTEENWAKSPENYAAGDAKAIVRSDIDKGWEGQGFQGYYGHGWYFQSFDVPESAAGPEHLYLMFGAVDTEAWVYLNGELVFEHTSASTGLPGSALWNKPFALDIKEQVKLDQPNLLAVRVYSSSGMAGIWKPAMLFATEKAYTASELDQ